MGNFTTRLTNDTPDAAVVTVRDGNGVDHRIAIDKLTGDIAVHQYNQYPADVEACTADQRRMIRAARANARYVADEETDAAIVRPSERPATLRAGIEVVESLGEAEFVRYFREFYDELLEPSPTTADPADVVTVTIALYLRDPTGTPTLEYVTSPALELVTAAETRWEYLNPADSMAAPDREPDVLCRLPPQTLPVSFGWPFQSFLVDHLKCQIRDIYWLRDEPVPDDCALEGIGNPNVDRMRETTDLEVAGD
ncbi:hypothetical protein [Natronobiforma cellulositropha]|uniref:hypothetical protein n=1 Tax=Natronobiforma cellulositropha TaxID=1679076 RepID=UPI0021D5C4CF|nr:hypothetical protein [Natronobiforma cellulositropha]